MLKARTDLSKMVILAVIVLAMLTACGDRSATQDQHSDEQPQSQSEGHQSEGQAPNDEPEVPVFSKDPVTLSFYTGAALSDEEIQKLILEPVAKKLPHITIKRATSNFEELVAAQETPDFYYAATYMTLLIDMNYPLDVSPLLERHQIDFASFDPVVVETIRTRSGGDKVYSIPFAKNTVALWYNQMLFDKFGVDSPTDGMTWDDAYALGRLMSRTDGGVRYRGIEPLVNGNIRNAGFVYSLPLVDSSTNRAYIDPKWAELFQITLDGYRIPGNERSDRNPLQEFKADQTLAMLPYFYNGMFKELTAAADLDWNVVQVPSYKDLPNVTIQPDYHQFVVSNTTKYVDQVMQVIATAVSDEVQLAAAKMGKIPASSKQEILQQFGAESAFLQGKNMAGIFKSMYAPGAPVHEYDNLVHNALNQAFAMVLAEDIDINTALAQAEEMANVEIVAASAKK